MIQKILNPLLMTCALLAISACTEQQPTSLAEQAADVAASQPAATPVVEVDPAEGDIHPANDGISAPLSFALTDLDGNEVKAEDFRGKWLVLNYWATWCAPCRDEIPELVTFQDNHDNVQVLGIAYEDAEVSKLKNFAADFSVNYPLLTMDVYNPPGFAEEGGLGLPTTIVYDPQGMRHDKHMGPIDEAGLIELIQ